MSLQEAAFLATPFFSKVLRIDASRDERRSLRRRCGSGSWINEQHVLSVLTLVRESKHYVMGVMMPFAPSLTCNRLLTGGGGERSGSCRPHWLRLMSGSMHRRQESSHFISQPAHLITPLIQPHRIITASTWAQASSANCWIASEGSEPAKRLFPLALSSEGCFRAGSLCCKPTSSFSYLAPIVSARSDFPLESPDA